MLSVLPVMRLSITTTSKPSANSRSHRCEPRNPAPPVTSARGMAATPLYAYQRDTLVHCVQHFSSSADCRPHSNLPNPRPFPDKLAAREGRGEVVQVQGLCLCP